MSASAEILCSRCGTPFPTERGKAAVTCVVCGQLRPDLDMTLDDDDDDLAGAMGAGAAGAALKPSAQTTPLVEDTPRQTSHLLQADESRPAEVFRLDRPYVAMSDDSPAGIVAQRAVGSRDSLTERLGPVLLIVAPLAAGMAGALNMLQVVPDFSKGSWYAVGTVFVALLVASLFGGLIASGIVYMIRVRWTLLLRGIFLGVAIFVGHYGVRELPNHILPRPDDLPGIVFRLH